MMQEFPEIIVERIEYEDLLLLLRQILPIAHGHILPVLARIHPLLDTNSLEIGFPELLEKFFILIHKALIKHPRDKVPLTTIFAECHLPYFPQIVVIPVCPLDVINQPALVGKAVFKVLCH